ncbi:MAG: RsiV family protein [Chitinispirillales bacterium]|nr:RsiV family protein [Chitinispirillales bacterium]
MLNKKAIQTVFLFALVFLITLSPEFGCTKRNNDGGASLKKSNYADTGAVTVIDATVNNNESGNAAFKKFELVVSDTVNKIDDIRVSFTYPTAIGDSSALAELRKNFIEQAFNKKYAGLEPSEVVKSVVKGHVDEVRSASGDDGNSDCMYYFSHHDTVFFPISGFLQYITFYGDYTCGAHGGYSAQNCLYNLADGKRVEPQDIFVKGWEQSVTKSIVEQYLEGKGLNSLDEDGYAEEESFVPDGYIMSFDDPQGITFAYNTYRIAPYVEGPQAVLVSWDKLKPYLNKQSVIYPKLRF